MKNLTEKELALIKDAERALDESLTKLRNAIDISPNVPLLEKLGSIYMAIKKQKSRVSKLIV